MNQTRNVYIVGSKRIPFVRSFTSYQGISPMELLTPVLKALNQSFSLSNSPLGDVGLGALMNSSSDWNLARETVLEAGLHPHTPAYNVQRACGTSLETTLQIALKISSFQIEDGIAGGVDTNSALPMEISAGLRNILLAAHAEKSLLRKIKIFSEIRPQYLAPKRPAVVEPRTGLSMGEHCELMVKEWKIPREAQDKLALASHQNGVKAYEAGFYSDLVIPFRDLKRDGTLRGDTSLEKLAKLKPSFDPRNGSLTAGNSSPLTDGASAVLLASEEMMKRRNWTPLARFVDAQSAAIDFVGGDGLLMAPTVAVGKLLERNKLSLQDFDFYEIHEAFAGQVLCTLEAWKSAEYCKKFLRRSTALGEIDLTKLNTVGSSVALGHPFAATGTRIVGTLAKLLQANKKGRGLISICTAGGMGVVAILEA